VAESRRLYEEEHEQLVQEAMQCVERGDWLYGEHFRALRAIPDVARERLSAILKKSTAPPSAQIKAAETLRTLGDPDGEAFWLAALTSKSAKLRQAALEAMRKGFPVDYRSEPWASRVLALFDDSDSQVSKAAIELSAYMPEPGSALPGAESKIIELLPSLPPRNRQAIAIKLGEIASTPEAVETVVRFAFPKRAKKYEWITGHALERLCEHPDAELSAPVRKAFQMYLLAFPAEQRDQQLVRDLAKVADDDALPVLQGIYNNPQDAACRLYSLQAMARLQPDRAVDLILDDLERFRNFDHIVNYSLPPFATEAEAERIIAALAPPDAAKESQPIPRGVVRLFWEKLGQRGRKAVEEHFDRLDLGARMWAMWKMQGLDLRSAAAELHASGVIVQKPEEILARIQAHNESRPNPSPGDLSDPDGMISLLAEAELLTMFDAETGEIPCRHDRLLEAFAAGAAGRFEPQYAMQFWRRESEDDFDAPYVVQFVYNDRLYRFAAESYGDWYDVASVQRALNTVLEDAGRPERFLPLDPGGQFAIFVFADPQMFLPIASKYGLPLSQDPMECVRQGREFERRIFGN
jgi:hypothetical protein